MHAEEIDTFETLPAVDHILVLVSKGATMIDSFRGGKWRSGAHVAGNIAMVEAGEVNRVRWRGDIKHETLQLHLPAASMQAAVDEIRDERSSAVKSDLISRPDPLVAQVMLSLAEAASAGVPDLYAESASYLLLRHLLIRSPHRTRPVAADAMRLHRIEDYMRANLARNITLADMARVASCSPFQLLRSCKLHWNQTPFQKLTSMRMERGCQLLASTDQSITNVAFECGYTNPSHFAVAFRRATGMSPSAIRR